jgi:hypothetical protein
MRREGLTTAPRMCVHLERIVRYPVQAPGVAALAYSCELGFDLLHAHLHVYNRFGRVEKVTVARPGLSLASWTFRFYKPLFLTPQATAVSPCCRRHCYEAAVRAYGRQVSGIGTRPPSSGRSEDRVHRSPWPLQAQAASCAVVMLVYILKFKSSVIRIPRLPRLVSTCLHVLPTLPSLHVE